MEKFDMLLMARRINIFLLKWWIPIMSVTGMILIGISLGVIFHYGISGESIDLRSAIGCLLSGIWLIVFGPLVRRYWNNRRARLALGILSMIIGSIFVILGYMNLRVL